MVTYKILDASAFINGYKFTDPYNLTVSSIIEEVKDFKSKLKLDIAIKEGKLVICEVDDKYLDKLNEIISSSGDIYRLSLQDCEIIALALQCIADDKDIVLLTDDYSIQNVLKILNIPFKSIITSGIKGIYNWKKICEGCKREFDENYPFDDCEICGSNLFKKRIKL